jgi:hypothetical protein
MLIITNDSLLKINCVLIDYLLRSLLSLGDWLNARVAIERAISIIVFVIILSFASHLQDPFHLCLINDEEENRIWYITEYSFRFFAFNTTMTIIHFFTPFMVNFLSGIFIIIRIAQRRLIVKEKKFIVEERKSKIKQQLAIQRKRLYKELIYQQIREHKHILITPFILILLDLPHLIISFLFGCMKSQRDPWLFLIGHFIPLVSPIAHFFVFVLSSEEYKEQFSKYILRIRR